MKFLVKEREEEISQISDLLKNNHKKVQADLLKVEKELSIVVT